MYHTKNEDIYELDELVIPNCLLEAAELSENCDLDIQCVSGAIIIGGIDPISIVLLFSKLFALNFIIISQNKRRYRIKYSAA